MRRVFVIACLIAAMWVGVGSSAAGQEPALERTIRGRRPETHVAEPRILVVDAAGPADSEASCRLTPAYWECFGVPVNATAIVVSGGTGDLLYGIAPPAQVKEQWLELIRSHWGRAVRFEGAHGLAGPDWSVTPLRMNASPLRPETRRPAFVADSQVAVTPVAPHTYWIAALDDSRHTVIDVSGVGIGRLTIPANDLRAGPPDVPLTVHTAEPSSLQGLVVDGRARPVPDAMVSLFETLAFAHRDDRKPVEYQRWIADGLTDERGWFEFGSLGRRSYEVVALHHTLGKADTEAEAGTGVLVRLKLVKPPEIRGRVLLGGRPQPGVSIRLLPQSAHVPAGSDPLEHTGGSTATDAGGRFAIGLPGQGTTQLVVGSPETGLLRQPLPEAGAMPAITDLGDLELPSPTEVLVQLNAPASCQLAAAGPVSTPGLSLVEADRHGTGVWRLQLPDTGFWILSLVCDGRDVPLMPPFVEAPRSRASMVVQIEPLDDPSARP